MLPIQTRFFYKAFDYTVASCFEFPELERVDHNNHNIIDITIETEELVDESPILLAKAGHFMITGNEVTFRISSELVFSISDGKKITVRKTNNVSIDQIRLYVLGSCMGVVLMQRKILPLHGSAIAINGRAYAFVGESGAGKSTLATAFLHQGYELLSDDVIAIKRSSTKTPIVIPSYPHQKLWDTSLQEFNMEASNYPSIYDRHTKYSVPVDSFYSKNLPLAGIFELVKSEDEQIGMKQILGLERFHKIHLHTYRNFLLPPLHLIEWHFRMTTEIIKQTDMFQLRRTTTTFTANQLVDIVVQKVMKEV